MRRQKCNKTEVPAETSETFDGEHFAEVNGSYKLADIISGRRTGSSLSTKLHWEVRIFDKTLLRIKNLCLRKKLSKVERQRHYHISCHGLKVNGGMLPVKNSKADIVKCVFYSMTWQQMHQKEIL